MGVSSIFLCLFSLDSSSYITGSVDVLGLPLPTIQEMRIGAVGRGPVCIREGGG